MVSGGAADRLSPAAVHRIRPRVTRPRAAPAALGRSYGPPAADIRPRHRGRRHGRRRRRRPRRCSSNFGMGGSSRERRVVHSSTAPRSASINQVRVSRSGIGGSPGKPRLGVPGEDIAGSRPHRHSPFPICGNEGKYRETVLHANTKMHHLITIRYIGLILVHFSARDVRTGDRATAHRLISNLGTTEAGLPGFTSVGFGQGPFPPRRASSSAIRASAAAARASARTRAVRCATASSRRAACSSPWLSRSSPVAGS